MLVYMHEIGSIHTFEDEAFLHSVSRISAAVLGVSVGVAFVFFSMVMPGLSELSHLNGWFAGIWWAVALLVGTVVVLAVHEGVHGLFFKLFAPAGSRVTFGANIKLGMLYACAEGIVYTRRQYLVVILAPTVVVTVLMLVAACVSGYPFCCYIIATAHLAGCVGDWKYAAAVLRNHAITHCEDTSWGVRFLAEGYEVPESAALDVTYTEGEETSKDTVKRSASGDVSK